MKLIVGLGNPGKQYENTRHNVGFLAVDFFLQDHPSISCKSKFSAQICEYQTEGLDGGMEKVFFVKPQDFMNLSGKVVREIIEFYKLNPHTDILVIHDDKDLAFGTVKQAVDSGSAGHNGVQNLIDELGTKAFGRIRVGIEARETNPPIPTEVFVLQNFTNSELSKLNEEIFPETNILIKEFIG